MLIIITWIFSSQLPFIVEITNIPGPINALTLQLNIEQYEIMRGPQSDAGVKVNNTSLY